MSTPRFVDVHCHILPAMDDGPKSWQESLAMARMAANEGVATIVATPHQLGSWRRNGGDAIRRQTAALQSLLQRHRIPLVVLPGADVRVEPELVPRILSGELLTLADRRRHILLELPHELYLPLDRVLSELHSEGITAILSHPERNLGILRKRGLAERLVSAGCLIQVTAGALVGRFGREVQGLAEWLVRKQLVHFVATDAHSVHRRRPLLRRAFDRVGQLVGRETALDLCCRNPTSVTAGKSIDQSVGDGRRWPSPGWLGRNKAG